MELLEKRGANPNREGETPHNGNNSNNSITSEKLLIGVKKHANTPPTIPSRDNNLFTFGHTSNSANWDLTLSYYF